MREHDDATCARQRILKCLAVIVLIGLSLWRLVEDSESYGRHLVRKISSFQLECEGAGGTVVARRDREKSAIVRECRGARLFLPSLITPDILDE